MKKSLLIGISIAVAISLLIVLGVFVYWNTRQRNAVSNISQSSSESSSAASVQSASSASPKPVTTTISSVTIEWLSQPQEVSVEKAFGDATGFELVAQNLQKQYQKEIYMVSDATLSMDAIRNELKTKMSWLLLGSVEGGELDGSNLYHVNFGCFENDSYCVGTAHKVLVTPDKRFFHLTRYSNSGFFGDEILNITKSDMKIANQDAPSVLSLPNSDIPLLLVTSTLERKDISNFKPAFIDAATQTQAYYGSGEQNQRYADNGCILAQNKDGTIAFYEFDFSKGEGLPGSPTGTRSIGKASGYGSVSDDVLDITWKNGKKNTYDYFHAAGYSCAGYQPCYQIHQIDPNSDQYENIGETSWGTPVYREKFSEKELSNSSNGQFPGITGQTYRAAFPDYIGGEKMAFREFYNQYPVILIQDPLGRYLEFVRVDFQPAVECGGTVDFRSPNP